MSKFKTVFQFLHDLIAEYDAIYETRQVKDEEEFLRRALFSILNNPPWDRWSLALVDAEDLLAGDVVTGEQSRVTVVIPEDKPGYAEPAYVDSRGTTEGVRVTIMDFRRGNNCDVCGLYAPDEDLVEITGTRAGSPSSKNKILACKRCLRGNRINVVDKLVNPRGESGD